MRWFFFSGSDTIQFRKVADLLQPYSHCQSPQLEGSRYTNEKIAVLQPQWAWTSWGNPWNDLAMTLTEKRMQTIGGTSFQMLLLAWAWQIGFGLVHFWFKVPIVFFRGKLCMVFLAVSSLLLVLYLHIVVGTAGMRHPAWWVSLLWSHRPPFVTSLPSLRTTWVSWRWPGALQEVSSRLSHEICEMWINDDFFRILGIWTWQVWSHVSHVSHVSPESAESGKGDSFDRQMWERLRSYQTHSCWGKSCAPQSEELKKHKFMVLVSHHSLTTIL